MKINLAPYLCTTIVQIALLLLLLLYIYLFIIYIFFIFMYSGLLSGYLLLGMT